MRAIHCGTEKGHRPVASEWSLWVSGSDGAVVASGFTIASASCRCRCDACLTADPFFILSVHSSVIDNRECRHPDT